MSLKKTASSPSGSLDAAPDCSGWGGHPRGLSTLFFTEMWERFSYAGLKAMMVLFLVTPLAGGGLGMDTKSATAIYGTYTMAAFLLCLPGGIIADRFIGAKNAVLYGGLIIAFGHFTMVFNSSTTFYLGLVLAAFGTGLLKPNVSTMVGGLYTTNDPRRDSGFSLFYMGINIGYVISPLIVGFVAEKQASRDFLASIGIDPNMSWHIAFGVAGIGMLFGLLIFWMQRGRLSHVGNFIPPKKADLTPEDQARQKRNYVIYGVLAVMTAAGAFWAESFWEGSNWQSVLPFLLAFDGLVMVFTIGRQEKLTTEEWRRMGVIAVFFVVTIAFWSAYEQKGSSLSLLIRDQVDRHIFGWEMPAAWFQSMTAFYVIIFAPIFAGMWLRLGSRQPSNLGKFILSLVIIGGGYLAFAVICYVSPDAKINMFWILLLFLIEVLAELCMSPVGLSAITKLAPAKLVGLMMGLWFFGSSFGFKLSGYFAGFYAPDSTSLLKLYGGIAAGLLILALILLVLLPFIKRMAGETETTPAR